MKTLLYYFSATGNCLTTARKLAEILGDCEMVNVAALSGKSRIIADADRVGFVFPVYYGNMPWPMRSAVSKMVFRPGAYAFAVTTQRGHVGAAAQRLDLLLQTRGLRLSLARAVNMPGNSFLSAPEDTQRMLFQQDAAIADQVADILAGKTEDNSPKELLPMTPICSPNNFRGITAEEACVGCGICEKVCPMSNIHIVEGKALIGDNCATCLACFHWCPQEAIWMSRQEEIARRSKYHHPDVRLKDFLLR